MPYKTYDYSRFLGHIKKDSAAFPVYFIYGDESYLIKQAARALGKFVSKLYPDFEQVVIRSTKLDENSIIDATGTVGFFSSYKLVVIRDLDVKKLSDTDCKKLIEIIDSLQECTVVFVFESGEFPAKPSAKIKKVIDKIGQSGAVVKLSSPAKSELVDFAAGKFSAAGISATRTLCDYLVTRVGSDMNLISMECDKVIAYLGGNPLSKQAICEVTVQDIFASAFEISKCILRHDIKSALEKLTDLFSLRYEPVAIVAAISTAYIDLYRAKLALKFRVDTTQVVADFGYKGREFRIRNALRDVRSLSEDGLYRALELIRQTDRRLKSEDVDKAILTEFLVTKLSMI